MVETLFPPSLNWYLSKIISTRRDGSVAYGSQNNICVLKVSGDRIYPFIIIDAHKDKVTSVTFSPVNKLDKSQNFVVSSAEDGFVKLWNINSKGPIIGHNSHSMQKDVVKVVCATWSLCNPQYIISAAENDTLVLWNNLNNTTTRFYLPKLKPTVIESSYHDEKIVGVGSKSGMVYIVKLVGNGEIIHRLRGHDKEVQALSWNPIPYINAEDNVVQQCFLASSSQEKEIFIWQEENGECVTKIQLPKNSFSKGDGQHGKWDPTTNFIPIFWASPNHLYAGTRYGELICCDPMSIMRPAKKEVTVKKGQKKPVPDYWRLVHYFHTFPVLAIAGNPAKMKSKNVNKVDDGSIKDHSNSEVGSSNSNVNTNFSSTVKKGHSNYSDTENDGSDNDLLPMQGLIWTAGKDQKLIAISENSVGNPVFNLHNINGHAFVMGVSPHDPNVVAIGAGDGKIRVWNVSKPSGHVRVFGQKVNDRVYSVAWHPYKESVLGFGTSEGRIGLIEVYSLKPPSNFMNRHSGKVYSLSWGPTFLENQSTPYDKRDLSLYSAGGHKILWHHPKTLTSDTLKIRSNIPCKKFVDICWKPDYRLLAVGSKKGYIYILKPPEFEVFASVLGTTKCIMSLTWHPSSTTINFDCTNYQGYLTYASIDNENVIRVYNCTEIHRACKMDQVALLKGHTAHVQFVAWSPHLSGRLISSSADCTVRIWDVAACTQLKKFVASQSILPLFCRWSPIDPDVLIAGYTERIVVTWRISSSARLEPVVKELKLEKGINIQLSELVNGSKASGQENSKEVEQKAQSVKNELNRLTLAKRNEDPKTPKESKMFGKAWGANTDPFQNCYELIKMQETGPDPSYKLPFLRPENEFMEFLSTEEETHKASNNWDIVYQQALWKGNLKELLEEHIVTGNLDDFLVSLAPYISPRFWHQACLSYSKTLAEKKLYRKAASYLLVIHKVQEAIELLEQAQLYLEAMCIARCRLPDGDPVFPNLLRKYADWLADTGSVLRASECFIYLNDFSEAVRLLAKKNQPEHLSLAALAAKRAGLNDLESEYSYRALLLCLENEKLELASRICTDHPNLKKLTLLYETHQLICTLDSEKPPPKRDLISNLKEITGIESDADLYKSLQYTYGDNTTSIPKKSVYIILAHELSLACCATEKDVLLSHIIKALSTASKYTHKEKDEVPMVFKLCTWLCLEEAIGYLSRDGTLRSDDDVIKPKVISLRAFFCLGIVELLRNILEHRISPIGNMNDYPVQLEKMLHDALDKETFKYFRNQVEMKAVEKRINEAYRRKNEQKAKEEIDNDALARNNLPKFLAKFFKNASEANGKLIESSEDEIIAAESQKMNVLKAKIKTFEDSRITAPNPAVIYCTLRDILKSSNEVEILNKVEKIWERLQLD